MHIKWLPFFLFRLDQVNTAYRSGTIFSVIDDRMGAYPAECVERFINLALKCCQEETEARPSMAEVVRELETIWVMMPELDSKTTESFSTHPGKVMSPSSSVSSGVNPKSAPYVSGDISGSDLVSGVVPTITPRWWILLPLGERGLSLLYIPLFFGLDV